MRRPPRGLSLIELLVAIAIIAALFGAATIAIDAAGGGRTLEREGRRFAALVAVACERAQVTGRDYGIHVGAEGYAFSVAQADGWTLEGSGDLAPHELARGISLALAREGTAVEVVEGLPDAPQAACFATGELTPFVASLSAGDLDPWDVEGAIDGAIESHVRAPAG